MQSHSSYEYNCNVSANTFMNLLWMSEGMRYRFALNREMMKSQVLKGSKRLQRYYHKENTEV